MECVHFTEDIWLSSITESRTLLLPQLQFYVYSLFGTQWNVKIKFIFSQSLKKLPISFVFLVLVKLHYTDNSVKYSLPSFFKSKAKYCTVEYSSWIANSFQYSAYLFTQILYTFILLVFRVFLKQFSAYSCTYGCILD